MAGPSRPPPPCLRLLDLPKGALHPSPCLHPPLRQPTPKQQLPPRGALEANPNGAGVQETSPRMHAQNVVRNAQK